MIQQLWILLQTLNHPFLWGIIKLSLTNLSNLFSRLTYFVFFQERTWTHLEALKSKGLMDFNGLNSNHLIGLWEIKESWFWGLQSIVVRMRCGWVSAGQKHWNSWLIQILKEGIMLEKWSKYSNRKKKAYIIFNVVIIIGALFILSNLNSILEYILDLPIP